MRYDTRLALLGPTRMATPCACRLCREDAKDRPEARGHRQKLLLGIRPLLNELLAAREAEGDKLDEEVFFQVRQPPI
jgi:hypothetical protein